MKSIRKSCLFLFLAACFVSPAFAAETDSIKLPPPQTDAGRPLMQALRDRHTARKFADKPLPPQTLANLLWAANGVNRPGSGKRTAPSANNWKEIEIYVALKEGIYRYNAKTHTLEKVLADDIRSRTGGQDFVGDAPVNLVYVADYSKMSGEMKEKEFYSAADTGFIAQNVYLYCASEGLATVVRGYVDRAALSKLLGLRPDQAVTLAQTVGYPVKP